MICILRWVIASAWIHIPHLSKTGEPRNRLLTGCPIPIKTESVSESVDKITGDCLRLQPFFMPTKNQKIAPRKPRTDAQRNRERILEVAKEAFTRTGAHASLDDIAKEAGVGAGTLYRHFPTRDALIEAVYRTEVEKLAAAEKKFSADLPPIDALRAWMLLFVDYIATKQIIGPALNSVVGGPSKLYEASRSQIRGAIDSLVKRAIKTGDIRRDLEPFDLVRALIGVSNVASGPDWQQSARRLVDILITGSRPIK
jgi:AcrR family transcriptional regulator